MKPARLIPLFLLLFLSSCVKSDETPSLEYVQKGDPLPSFTVSGENGTSYSSQNALGKVTLICFFNTTCPDCHRELPKLQYVWEQLADDPSLEIVCIGRARTLSEIRTYWQQEHFTLPYYEDPTQEIYKLFAERGIPRLYFIGKEGKVKDIWVERFYNAAQQDISSEELLAVVKSYLETP